MQRNFDHTTEADTVGWARAKVPKPQSDPAMTRSRPTTRAQLQIRCAINLGCSTKLDVESRTPEINTLSADQLRRLLIFSGTHDITLFAPEGGA